MHVTILHFNDLHGQLERLPRLATLVQRARARAMAEGHQVLLLEAGDSSDRAAWESDITKGRANFALLEALGVQASVAGNGEALQWGRAALHKLVGSVHFPVLAANLVDLEDPARPAVPGLQAVKLFELDGFKLGVLGVTAVYKDGYERFGFASTDPRPALEAGIARLKSEGAQIIVLLSHLGYATPEEKKTWPDPEAYTDDQAAADFPEIAIIVGGHSHTTLEQPVLVGETVIVQAGDYGRFLGQLDVEVDSITGRARPTGYALHPTEGVPPDPTLSATLEFVREEASQIFEAVIGQARSELPHSFDSPSAFAGRVADALREVCRADLAIFFSGFAHRGLAAGPITRRDLYEALPGSAHVTAAQVSGAQIQRMVEKMLASPYRTESFNPKRSSPPLGLPAHSANVELSYALPEGRLTRCLIDGQPLDPARRYRLASTFTTLSPVTDDPEYDFVGLEPGQVVEHVRVEEVLWEIVEGWIRREGVI